MNCSTLCRRKNAFPYSNDVIIMAQAGATLTTRGITPANIPLTPFCWKMFRRMAKVPTFGKDFTGLSAYKTFSPNSICLCVLTTSNGAVMNAAIYNRPTKCLEIFTEKLKYTFEIKVKTMPYAARCCATEKAKPKGWNCNIVVDF